MQEKNKREIIDGVMEETKEKAQPLNCLHSHAIKEEEKKKRSCRRRKI